MAGILTVDTIQSDSSYASTLNVASKINFTSGMQIGGTDATFGNRNKVINGNFIIAQKSTSANSNTNNTVATVDRWKTWISSGYITQSRQSFTPGQTTVPGNPLYYFRNVVTNDASSGHYSIVTHNIEDTSLFAGQSAVLSFWAKADTNRTMVVEFNQNFGTGGSARVTGTEAPTHLKTFSLTSTWTKYSFPVTLTSISGKTNNSADSFLEIYFWFSNGSTLTSRIGATLSGNGGTFDIAQVQFEKGNTATDFEDRFIGQEIALSKEYYQKLAGFTAAGGSATYIAISIPFTVPMRSSPSVGQTGVLTIEDIGTADRTQSSTSISIRSSRINSIGGAFSMSNFTSLTQFRPFVHCVNFNGADNYITLSAEF